MSLDQDIAWGLVPDFREDTTLPSSNDEWRALMVATIEERGADYVYETKVYGDCRYLALDEGGGKVTGGACLIGCMLLKAGVDPDKLYEAEGLTAATALKMGMRDTVPVGTLNALQAAQQTQDNGEPWGEALRSFDHVLAEARKDEASLV